MGGMEQLAINGSPVTRTWTNPRAPTGESGCYRTADGRTWHEDPMAGQRGQATGEYTGWLTRR